MSAAERLERTPRRSATTAQVQRSARELHLDAKHAPPFPIPAPIAPFPINGGIYYAHHRERGIVKIGRATNIRERLIGGVCWVPSLTLLAWQPGAKTEEADEHERWSEHRHAGEWFILDSRLAEHIARIREKHGNGLSGVFR